MQIAIKKPVSYNKRLILIMVAVTSTLSITLPTSCMPVLFKEISQDLHLNLVQIGSIWGIISFGSIFMTPVGGILCDKLGVKRMLILAGMLSGVAGALRGFSNGSFALMATTFFCGIAISILMPAIVLTASQAAGEENQGVGQCWVSVGGGAGWVLGSMASAALISPLVGGWQNVFLIYGGISILNGLSWLLISKWPEIRKYNSTPVKQPFVRVLVQTSRNKTFWMIGLILLTYQGCLVGMQGYLPYYLQANGWDTAAAGGAMAVYSAVSIVGVIPLTILSDRLRSRKIYLFASFISAAIGVGLLSVVHGGGTWFLVILIGIFAQMNTALAVAMCMEGNRASPASAGTILGLVLSFGLIGRTFAPPVGNSLADNSASGWPFLFWAGLALVGLVIMFFVKESRRTVQVAKPAVVTE